MARFLILVAVVAAFLGWYAFLPERMVVNRRVDEAMPAARGSSSPQILASGHVYMVAADDAKDSASVLRAGFIDFRDHQGQYGRPKLYARSRRGIIEISRG